MILKFATNELQTISFLTNPDASFVPPHELNEPDRRLKGFNWRITEKPTKTDVLAKRTGKSVKPVKAVAPAVVKGKAKDKTDRQSRKDRKILR